MKKTARNQDQTSNQIYGTIENRGKKKKKLKKLVWFSKVSGSMGVVCSSPWGSPILTGSVNKAMGIHPDAELLS